MSTACAAVALLHFEGTSPLTDVAGAAGDVSRTSRGSVTAQDRAAIGAGAGWRGCCTKAGRRAGRPGRKVRGGVLLYITQENTMNARIRTLVSLLALAGAMFSTTCFASPARNGETVTEDVPTEATPRDPVQTEAIDTCMANCVGRLQSKEDNAYEICGCVCHNLCEY
jgi:hypothetical protein